MCTVTYLMACVRWDAVRAGYDEITHINYVMMQAMPDDVVQQSITDVGHRITRATGTP